MILSWLSPLFLRILIVDCIYIYTYFYILIMRGLQRVVALYT